MKELLIFILISYGLSNIIVNEYIFEPITRRIRKINDFFFKLFGCTTCLSFWIGMVLSLFINLDISNSLLMNMILQGILACGSVNIIEWIKIKFNYEEDL